ncbi:MAG: hypothetical protein ABH832_00335 [bacterium]
MILKFNKISLHPRFSSIIDIFINIFYIYAVTTVKSWWVLMALLIGKQFVHFIILSATYHPTKAIRWRNFFSLFILNLGVIMSIIFLEWKVAIYILGAVYIILSASSTWMLPNSGIGVSLAIKPHLRWRFISTVFGLAGTMTGVQAIMVFQVAYRVNNWIWFALLAIVSVLIAIWWWWEYDIKYNKLFLLSALIFFLIMIEIIAVVALLPLGYLISGLILTWIWYIVWLLFRFNMSSEGINWKKQSRFIISNLLIFILFLFFIAKWK